MAKIKFPKETRTKWLKALRGGRYKQVDGTLFSQGAEGYCCLGVLGRVCSIKKDFLQGNGDFRSVGGKIAEKIPSAIIKISKKTGEKKNTDFCNKLIEMNDDEGKDFKEIADYIEKRTIGA